MVRVFWVEMVVFQSTGGRLSAKIPRLSLDSLDRM